jgi:hypothetical protein
VDASRCSPAKGRAVRKTHNPLGHTRDVIQDCLCKKRSRVNQVRDLSADRPSPNLSITRASITTERGKSVDVRLPYGHDCIAAPVLAARRWVEGGSDIEKILVLPPQHQLCPGHLGRWSSERLIVYSRRVRIGTENERRYVGPT